MNEHERNALTDTIMCLGPTQMFARINQLIDERDEASGRAILNANALRLRTDLCKRIYAAASGCPGDSSLEDETSAGIWGRWCARLVVERKRLVAEVDDLRKLVSRQGADLLRACQQLCAYEGTAKDLGGPEALGLAVTCEGLRGQLRNLTDAAREFLTHSGSLGYRLDPLELRRHQTAFAQAILQYGAPPVVIRAETQSVGKDAICEVCDGGPGNDGGCACPRAA